MTTPIFFDWDKIEELVQPYRGTAVGALLGSEFFSPHAFAFVGGLGEKHGLILNVQPTHLRSRTAFDAFMNRVRRPPNVAERTVEASGFMAMMPYSLAKEYVTVERVEDPGELIGVFHIEHLYSGVRTWVVEDRRKPDWRLYASGIWTLFPPCFPLSAYGQSRGSA